MIGYHGTDFLSARMPDLADTKHISDTINAARSLDGIPFPGTDHPWSSIGALLRDRAAVDGSKTWLNYCDENGTEKSFTYREFRAHVNATARYLLAQGITFGSRVATIAHNHCDTVVQYVAAWTIGATVVPINVTEDDDRIAYILENSDARLVFIRADYWERMTPILGRLPALSTIVLCGDPEEKIDTPPGVDRFESICDDLDGGLQLLPRLNLLNREALIVYTSGTTGAPKGVVLTQGNLLVDAREIAAWHGVDAATTMMCVLPIHHVNGTIVTLVTPLLAGGSVLLHRKFKTESFFPSIAAHGVAIVSVVPTLLAYLESAALDLSALDLSRFRHIICGAGPLTCELADRFESRYGFPIVHGYGLSETTCYSCFLPVDLSEEEHREWMQEHGFPSIGVPLPANEMAIHDENGTELPDGEKGEIVIRGHTVMAGYYENPEANAIAFAHGWFRSGDEGFMRRDDAGRRYFFITGRLKELIIRGGVNLSPLEIDEVINAHPKVDAGIAVGFENSWYGEEIGAYIRKADDSLTAEEIIAHCAERLPFGKQPKVIVFGDDIPVTSTGKYQRNRVKHLFSAHKETQFRDAGSAQRQ